MYLLGFCLFLKFTSYCYYTRVFEGVINSIYYLSISSCSYCCSFIYVDFHCPPAHSLTRHSGTVSPQQRHRSLTPFIQSQDVHSASPAGSSVVSEELVIHQPDQDGQLQHDDDGEQQLVGYHPAKTSSGGDVRSLRDRNPSCSQCYTARQTACLHSHIAASTEPFG